MRRKLSELLITGAAVLTAFALWYLIFVVPRGDFWVKMAVSAGTLGLLSLLMAGSARGDLLKIRLTHVALGVVAAALLYGVFWLGKIVLIGLSATADESIRSVYAPRESTSLWLIGVLLLVFTGPAEEIFWRGLVQRILSSRVGKTSGWLVTTGLYAAVHLWTGNGPLVLAALVAGLSWGWLYRHTESLIPGIVSHSLWGVAIFVLWPLG